MSLMPCAVRCITGNTPISDELFAPGHWLEYICGSRGAIDAPDVLPRGGAESMELKATPQHFLEFTFTMRERPTP